MKKLDQPPSGVGNAGFRIRSLRYSGFYRSSASLFLWQYPVYDSKKELVTINLPFTLEDVITIAIQVIAAVLAFSVHEYAHGFAAYKLGDTTAKIDGRLSLNPLKHVDIIGLICLVWLHFGWAKPVRVNTSRFSNPKQDMAITAFAGPFSNFLLALIALLIFYPAATKIGSRNAVMGNKTVTIRNKDVQICTAL